MNVNDMNGLDYSQILDETRFANFGFLDQKIDNFERALSRYAWIPVIGVAPGALKVAFGIIQMIVGLAIGILTAPFVYNLDADSLNCHAWSYVVHGLANIIAGSLEAIPGVGYALYDISAHDVVPGELEHKFFPYGSLYNEVEYI